MKFNYKLGYALALLHLPVAVIAGGLGGLFPFLAFTAVSVTLWLMAMRDEIDGALRKRKSVIDKSLNRRRNSRWRR